MSAQRAHEGVSTRNVERDMTLRPLIGFRITCMTTPLIPAIWTGISGVFSRNVTAILVVVALVLGATMFTLWSNTFLQLDRGTLRMRRYGRLREIPIRELGYPDRRDGRSLVVRAGGCKAFTLYDRVWSPAELDGLARELSARASRVRSTELGHA